MVKRWRRSFRAFLMRIMTAPLFFLLSAAGSATRAINDMSKVAIYIRWSTDDQSEGTTLDTQRDACIHYAHSQGFGTIPPELIFIDDGYSGGNLDRPAMTSLRQMIKRGEVNFVIVNTIDRLSRNIVDAVNLVLHEWDRSCHVKCVKQPIDTTSDLGRMIFGILAMFADFERSQIHARTFGGRVQRAQQGRNPGGRLRLGYKQGDNPGDILVDEAGARLVNRIFRLYVEGNGDRTIAALLNEEGIKSPRGREWERSSIGNILASERYIGRWEWGGTKRNSQKGNLPRRVVVEEPLAVAERPDLAIVPVELFDQVQLLRQRVNDALKVTSGRALTSTHLLSGLVKCGRCGSSMQIGSDGRSKKGEKRYKNPYFFFRCTGRQNKGAAFCDCGTFAERELDAVILWHLDKLRQPGVRARIEGGQVQIRVTKLADARAARTVVVAESKRFAGEMERIRRDYRAEKLAIDDYNEMRRDIERDSAENKAKLERLEQTIAVQEQGAQEQGQWAALLDEVNDWEALPLNRQKALLRELVDRIAVYRPTRSAANPDLDIMWRVPGVVFDNPPQISVSSLEAD